VAYFPPLPGARQRLTTYQRVELLRLHAEGKAIKDLAWLYRVPKHRIKNVLRQPQPKGWL
jgi:hypothetical protein